MQLLTQSRLAAARACQRLHRLRYDLGYQATQEQAALRFGTLIHAGLEQWWLATDGERLRAALATLHGEIDPFERAKAEVLLAGYDQRWGAEPFDVLAVEQEFRTELLNPQTGAASRTYLLAGKLDAIVRDRRDGAVRIVEHKTSALDIRPGSTYWRRLRLDGQVSIYFEGAKSLGYDAVACVYDVLGKPALRPLQATPAESRKYTKDGRLYAAQRENDETPDEYRARLLESVAAEPDRYFARGEVMRLEQEMADAMIDVWQLGTQIRENANAGRFPRNPDSCERYGKMCQFFEVCSGAASLEDESLFTRSDNVHPELAAINNESSKEESINVRSTTTNPKAPTSTTTVEDAAR